MDKFADIPYNRPDLKSFRSQSNKLIDQLEQASDAATARRILFELQELEQRVDTMITVAHIRNTIDTTDVFYDQEVNFLNDALPTLIPLQIRFFNVLLACSFRSDLESEFGSQLFINAETELKVQDDSIMSE